MGIVRDLYYARKMSAGLKLPAPTVALLIKRLRLAAAMGGGVTKTVSGTMVHITDALAKAALSVLVNITPIQPGSGDPAPDNVRPISGLTGLSVYRTGKNLFNKNATDQNAAHALSPSTATEYSAGSYTVTGFIKVKEGVKYITSGTGGSNDVCFYDESKARLSGSANFSEARTAPTGAVWLKFDYKTANADTVQLEEGSTATAYEPYQGTTYAVDWTTEAGTVYGGTLDVVTGVLTVDKAKFTITGNEAYTGYKEGNFFRMNLRNVDYGHNNNYKEGLCNKYTVRTSYESINSNNNSIAFNSGSSVQVLIRDDSCATANELIESLNSVPVEVVYPLATPLTYQLTPQEVDLLLGENYVWSSSGDTVSVTYYAEGNANTLQALNILLGGRYSNPKTADDVSDKEALEIILGGNK